jgi:PAP2 superfamily
VTASVAVPHWGKRKPWVLASGDQLRPGAPPALSSELWVRDYNEIKALGGKASTQRSAAQTEIARFWEATQPVIYYPLARAVALQPGREVTQNARLLAAAGMAMDDALIAIFDAKYAYNFWRPVTAIRNGEKDGNDATERDPAWAPLIDTPMHPEYPCAHCVLSGSLGAVLRAELGNGPLPRLATTSPTAPGVTRSWTSIAEFTQEVANARIYDGVHYRNSTEVGSALGGKVGELVAAKVLR